MKNFIIPLYFSKVKASSVGFILQVRKVEFYDSES